MAILEKAKAQASPATRSGPAWPGVHELAVWLAAGGWMAMVLMWVTDSAGRFGHDQDGLPAALALGLFLVGWVVMVAAMMLPWGLPSLRQLAQSLPSTTTAAAPTFVAGFFVAWAFFGAAAFAADVIVHLAVETIPWLAQRPHVIGGGVAMMAGATELSDRRPPPAGVSTSPDDTGPWAIGRAHAVDQIRHCWPLMILSMAVGMTSPAWMVGLTLAMALKLRGRAAGALRLVGLGLVGLGAAVAVNPSWMPVVLETARSAT